MNHQISEPMVLPPDVLIIAPHEVSPEVLASLDRSVTDHFIVTRPRSRCQSRIVNSEAALLLAMFRQPFTIIDAALALSSSYGRDPQVTLEEVFGTLRPFLQAKWLVPASSEEAGRIEPLAGYGQVIAKCTILECVQVLEDTDVYEVRTEAGDFAALKLARRDAPRRVEQLLRHEAMVLRELAGGPVPHLLAEGKHEEMAFIVTSWFAGVSVDKVAQELRARSSTEAWRELLNLCIAIVHAYSELHERDVIHGDVYPKNVLCDMRMQIMLIDFGFARCGWKTHFSNVRQRGVAEYHEPELAYALLDARTGIAPETEDKQHLVSRPLCTSVGEQYAVAALLYRLVCGHAYLRFSPHREEMLRQITEDQPLKFSDWGAHPWPELETILKTALAKQPEERFESMKDFEASLRKAELPSSTRRACSQVTENTHKEYRELIDRFIVDNLSEVTFDISLPHASVAYGSAGIAYGLYALSCIGEEPGLLAAADAWAVRAERERGSHGAFASQVLEITEQQAGPSSVYFGACGIPLVQALIAWAMGNEPEFHHLVKDFVETGGQASVSFDLALGKAGVLQGCAILLDLIKPRKGSSLQPSLELLTSFGRKLAREIWTEEARNSIKDYLGISHGLAGLCYSSLSWSRASGDPVADITLSKLDELLGHAQEHGRGLRWPLRVHHQRGTDSDWMESWCHGAPGYVYLWTLAGTITRNQRFLEYAERSAWTAWEAPDTISTLCCGYAGRAYALLAFWREVGGDVWIERAASLASRAARAFDKQSPSSHALFKGGLGVAVLLSELTSPHGATFPLFDFERRANRPTR